MSTKKTPVFEEYVKELEQLVEVLDHGNVNLEDAIKHFERGVKISKECYKILNQSEKKIEQLMKDRHLEELSLDGSSEILPDSKE